MATTTATTKNNVQVVQQGFNEFLKGNIDGILTFCTEDVKWEHL
jgi:ketosteroid isomerase-like protein